MSPRIVLGQRSWPLKTPGVEAWVTETGGHLGPVTWTCGSRKIRPLSVAPWSEERLSEKDIPAVLRALRGDFFCLPFGSNDTPFQEERHPVHGETANSVWKLKSLDKGALHASLATKIRRGRVDKFVTLREGDPCVYQRHVVTGMSGPTCYGQHLMLRFVSAGLLSTSRFVYGQVFPRRFEDPAMGGYQSLKPGAGFRTLGRVPTLEGGFADLSRYPARRGFDDLAMIVADARPPFAWTAVSFPEQRYVCFTLKNPRVLRQTVLWFSNGGRHYPPWNGRHVNVLGVEETTSYFHCGIAPSTEPNPVSERGYPTSACLKPGRPLVVNVIFGVSAAPRGFDRVESIRGARDGNSLILRSGSGLEIDVPADLAFLAGS